MPRSQGLSSKQRRFVDEYAVDCNATQAAIRAGYSEKTAQWIGPQLLGKTHVSEAVAARQEQIARKVGWDAEKVLIRLADMADADIADILTEDGNYKPIQEWPVLWRRMLQGCDVEETFETIKTDGQSARVVTGQVVKIKFIDRLKNMELIGRHVGVRAFASEAKTSGKVTLEGNNGQRITVEFVRANRDSGSV